MGLEQKVAVITGASRGIGAALVKAYRDRNYRVVATARTMQPSNDDDVLTVSGDIADRKTAERAISEGMARFGRIDTLVNNAGIFIAKPFTQYTDADYAAMLGVNVSGFFYTTQLAIAEMEKRGSGHVVQITTSLIDHAIAGVPSVLASLTKGSLNAATKSLAIEYAKRGIRVNAVALGVIKSPMHPTETHAQRASPIALHRQNAAMAMQRDRPPPSCAGSTTLPQPRACSHAAVARYSISCCATSARSPTVVAKIPSGSMRRLNAPG
jgi:NAD(P)-dependent dehydrogenase (short-subunit alcohol dehydrogenase family)